MIWALNTQFTRQLPEEAWESGIWYYGDPNCAYHYSPLGYELCVEIIGGVFGYLLIDAMCDAPLQCAICQLDTDA